MLSFAAFDCKDARVRALADGKVIVPEQQPHAAGADVHLRQVGEAPRHPIAVPPGIGPDSDRWDPTRGPTSGRGADSAGHLDRPVLAQRLARTPEHAR